MNFTKKTNKSFSSVDNNKETCGFKFSMQTAYGNNPIGMGEWLSQSLNM